MIKVDIATLLIATIPLCIAAFGGFWVLLKQLVFKPLNEISKDLKDFKRHVFKLDKRITVNENDIKHLQQE